MKTIAFGKQPALQQTSGNSILFRSLFVLAALGGLYYFRRRGGSVGDLWSAGRQGIDQARDFINRTAPSVDTQDIASHIN